MILPPLISPEVCMKVFRRSPMLPHSCSCGVAPVELLQQATGAYSVASLTRVQNCRTCSRDCGPVWHGQSLVCASTNRRMCRSRRQCPVRDGWWRFVAAAQGRGSDSSAFWDWLECPFYDGLCLRLSEGHRMFLGAVASLQHSGLANRQLRIT